MNYLAVTTLPSIQFLLGSVEALKLVARITLKTAQIAYSIANALYHSKFLRALLELVWMLFVYLLLVAKEEFFPVESPVIEVEKIEDSAKFVEPVETNHSLEVDPLVEELKTVDFTIESSSVISSAMPRSAIAKWLTDVYGFKVVKRQTKAELYQTLTEFVYG